MRERNLSLLIAILILAAVVIWIDLPNNPGLHIHLGPIKIDRDIMVRQGLDLQGGLQVLLVADLPEGQKIDRESMEAARIIVANRVNGLGVVEPVVQLQGERRIIVELPGLEDPEEAIATIQETGLLEFVDTGNLFLPPGTVVKTDYEAGTAVAPGTAVSPTTTVLPTPPLTGTEGLTTTPELTVTQPLTAPAGGEEAPPTEERIFHTVMTGKHLKTARVGLDQYGKPEILFELKPDGAQIFAEHTRNNIGRYLAIVLDKQVISCPRIETVIPEGRGRITGKFALEEARRIAIQLRYGALPVPLRVETARTVGPTLGQESVRKSITAGAIGLAVVFLFMLIYYRLPGFLADLALALYALLNFAVYKFGVPLLFSGVTLTLPGITGFLLSTGMAVDANILVFERLKEELRAGRSLGGAIEAGFERAWTSIRDSNISTVITCLILYYFGSHFGASMVKGFAITLVIGVIINMFTAIVATRTFFRFLYDTLGEKLREKKWLLGI